ncbi:hypothetical protein Aab01nite_30530 [Paractinoplanes abujensis]|nr:hypothetical protein Aab01nite_30530 [Actinoplanes abujensis]
MQTLYRVVAAEDGDSGSGGTVIVALLLEILTVSLAPVKTLPAVAVVGVTAVDCAVVYVDAQAGSEKVVTGAVTPVSHAVVAEAVIVTAGLGVPDGPVDELKVSGTLAANAGLMVAAVTVTVAAAVARPARTSRDRTLD